MSKDCGCFHPKKSYDFTIIDEMTPFNKDTFNKLKEENIVKEKEVTLNDVINYYYAFLQVNVWPIFGVARSNHPNDYTINEVFKSIKFYGPDSENRNEEQKKIAKEVNNGFLSILNFYNSGTSPSYVLNYFKELFIPNIEKMLKPDNSAQIAELTAIKQNLTNKMIEISSIADKEQEELEKRKRNLQKELNEVSGKMDWVFKEAESKMKHLEININNISNKINKLK